MIDEDQLPLLHELLEVLDSEPDGLRQMQAIELLMARFALRMGDPRHARKVLGGMHEHALQMVEQMILPDNAVRYS